METIASHPTPVAAESPTTRDRILDVAEALFAERGLAGTAVRDIARGAGLTPASLYNHFEGKRALYDAVLDRGVRPLLSVLESLPERQHSSERVDDSIDAIMAHLATRPHLPRLIYHETISGGESLKRLVGTWIRPLLEQAMAGVRADVHNDWTEEEIPLVIEAWLNLVFGHFAMAPLLAEVLGADPLAPEGIERQTRFLRKLATRMMGQGGLRA